MDVIKQLGRGIELLHLEPTPGVIEQLSIYFHELVQWNKKINLVGKASPEEIIENHFLDSLTLLPIVAGKPDGCLLDVGTGAGFPGLVLKCALPALHTVLLEPRQKRVSFLRHVARKLALADLDILPKRLDPGKISPDLRRYEFNFITSRAVSELQHFLKLIEPVSNEHCRILCMKGPRAKEELAAWGKSTAGSHFQLLEVQDFILPFSKAHRKILVFQKQ